MAAAAKLASGFALRSDILAKSSRQPRPVKAPPNCGLVGIVRWFIHIVADCLCDYGAIVARVRYAESDPAGE